MHGVYSRAGGVVDAVVAERKVKSSLGRIRIAAHGQKLVADRKPTSSNMGRSARLYSSFHGSTPPPRYLRLSINAFPAPSPCVDYVLPPHQCTLLQTQAVTYYPSVEWGAFSFCVSLWAEWAAWTSFRMVDSESAYAILPLAGVVITLTPASALL